MAETNYLTHINLHGSHLIDAGFEKLAVAPTTSLGRIYFDTVVNRLKYWDGTMWVDPASVANAVTAIDSSTVGVTVDDSDLSAVTVDIADASGATKGLMAAAHFTAVNDATDAATAGTVVKRDAAGTFHVATPTAATHPATKDYVDTLVSSGMTIKGATDCSTTPDYPAGIVGDTYHVSTSGKIGGAAGEDVQVGDVYICVADSATGDQATVGSNWVIVQRNDFTATTLVAGNVRLADAAEVTAGTSTETAVTPADVTTMVGSRGATHTETLASGSTSYTITHNLGGTVHMSVYNKTSGDVVFTDISHTDGNVAVIEVNTALAVDHAVTCVYSGTIPA